MPIIIIQRANMLNNFPKIQGWGIKIVHARASGLHFPTPFWAWGWPWGWYPKFDLTRFFPFALLMSYPKIIFLGLLVWEELGKKIILYFSAATERADREHSHTLSFIWTLFLDPVGCPWVLDPIWPAYNHHLGTAHFIFKNHHPSPPTRFLKANIK